MGNDIDYLKQKIAARKAYHGLSPLDKRKEKDEEATKSWMGMGMRIGTDLLAGIIVGGIIGYSIDYFLGTKPWALIILLFLGGVAGTLNVCMMLLKRK